MICFSFGLIVVLDLCFVTRIYDFVVSLGGFGLCVWVVVSCCLGTCVLLRWFVCLLRVLGVCFVDSVACLLFWLWVRCVECASGIAVRSLIRWC